MPTSERQSERERRDTGPTPAHPARLSLGGGHLRSSSLGGAKAPYVTAVVNKR